MFTQRCVLVGIMFDLRAHAEFLDGVLERQKRRRKVIAPDHLFPPAPTLHNRQGSSLLTGEANETESKENVINYLADEETVRNDYTAWYNRSGIPGSDYILGANDTNICEE